MSATKKVKVVQTGYYPSPLPYDRTIYVEVPANWNDNKIIEYANSVKEPWSVSEIETNLESEIITAEETDVEALNAQEIATVEKAIGFHSAS